MKEPKFKAGDVIRHTLYGRGFVLGVDRNNQGDIRYEVFFKGLNRAAYVMHENAMELDKEAVEAVKERAKRLFKTAKVMGINTDKLADTPAEEKKTKDAINHPSHYNVGKIEVIDFIESHDILAIGFNLGNAIKYLSRAGHKDASKTIEDLGKAKWYCERQINYWKPLSRAYSGNLAGRINVIDYIEDKHFSYNIGRALEYIDTAMTQKKLNAIRMMKEAVKCIDREINQLKKSKEAAA